MNKSPFFSIVIATYNYGKFIEDAIKSVLSQSCQDFELIIVDGGSKDNTLDIIKRYEERIAWWVSEPDKGQSEAFNKGFNHAKGKYFTWLNADDILLPDTLKKVKEKLESHPKAKWATGNFLRFREDNKKIIETQWGPHFLPHFLQTFDSPSVIFGPTTFWSKEIYDNIGGLDESLHYSMDAYYWLLIRKAGYKQVRVNHYCWAFRMHDASKTAEYGNHQADEETARKKAAEKEYRIKNTGYHCSKFKRILGLLMRFVDGSFFKSQVIKFKMLNKDINKFYDI